MYVCCCSHESYNINNNLFLCTIRYFKESRFTNGKDSDRFNYNEMLANIVDTILFSKRFSRQVPENNVR